MDNKYINEIEKYTKEINNIKNNDFNIYLCLNLLNNLFNFIFSNFYDKKINIVIDNMNLPDFTLYNDNNDIIGFIECKKRIDNIKLYKNILIKYLKINNNLILTDFNKFIYLSINNNDDIFIQNEIYIDYNQIDKEENYNKFLNMMKSFIVYPGRKLDKEIINEICKLYNENGTIIKIFTILPKIKDVDMLFEDMSNITMLWEEEPITNLIFNFEESRSFNNKLKKNIKYILLYEYFLLKILTFDTKEKNDNIEISHYTSLDVLLLLLNVKEHKKESRNIRINNITTVNDHKEGKMLERIFNKNNINIEIESDEKTLTLETSYSRNKDSLTMFRLYGKKENKEATGICLVLDNKYFDKLYTYYNSRKLKYEDNEEKFEENKRNLYWMLYYNEKENQIIYNKEKSKYTSNIIDLNDLNNPDYKAELKENDKKENMIKYAFAKIFYYTKEIKKQIEENENYKNIKNQLYSYLFENIKYIVKHEAFFEEQELRMLVTNDYKSDEILIDNDNKKLYIDYIKLFDENTNYIKEIIIGSKVENNKAVAEYIRKVLHSKSTEMNKLDDIKVSISEAPLR